MESFVLLAQNLNYLEERTCDSLKGLCQRQLRVLNGYIKSVKTKLREEKDGLNE